MALSGIHIFDFVLVMVIVMFIDHMQNMKLQICYKSVFGYTAYKNTHKLTN